jgi:site-specific DNA recombinase
MLQNRIYRSDITHKGKSYPGERPAIIDQPLWDEVSRRFSPKTVSSGQPAHAQSTRVSWAALCLTRPASA